MLLCMKIYCNSEHCGFVYSYVDGDGKQLVAADDQANTVELGSGGSELVITRKEDTGTYIRTLGSREYLRYYRQKPRPSPIRDVALAAALASRFSLALTLSSLPPLCVCFDIKLLYFQVQEHGFNYSAI